jgi:hypothetical protein
MLIGNALIVRKERGTGALICPMLNGLMLIYSIEARVNMRWKAQRARRAAIGRVGETKKFFYGLYVGIDRKVR